jgi:hypothetical protein
LEQWAYFFPEKISEISVVHMQTLKWYLLMIPLKDRDTPTVEKDKTIALLKKSTSTVEKDKTIALLKKALALLKKKTL